MAPGDDASTGPACKPSPLGLPVRAQLGQYFWGGLGLAALLVGYEFFLARRRDRAACFRAFLHNHWVGAAIFAGIALDFALRPVA